MRAKVKISAVAAVACLCSAGSAQAGPISAGFTATGFFSSAVTPAGTGLFADAAVSGSGGYSATVCRLPRGASACTLEPSLTFPAASGSQTYDGTRMFASGGTVYLASVGAGASESAVNQTFLATSTDDGATFSAPRTIATQPAAPDASGEFVALALDTHVTGGAIATLSEVERSSTPANNGVYFQLAPVTGGAVTSRVKLFTMSSDDLCCTQVTVGVLPDGRIAAAFAGDSGLEVKISNAGATNLNDPASWTGATTTTANAGLAYLLTSTSHLDLVYAQIPSGAWVDQRLDSGTAAPAVTIPVGTYPADSAFAVDPAGEVFATYGDATGFHLVHSDSGLTTFSSPATLACSAPQYAFDYGLAANAPGDGFASWFDPTTSLQVLPFSSSCASSTTTTTTTTTTTSTTTAVPPPVTPVISHLAQAARSWRLPHSRRHGRAPVGTTFTFRLNIAARVTLAFRRIEAGQRVGRSCVAPSRRRRHAHACQRLIATGSLTAAEAAGARRIAFSGRIGRRTLPLGSYEVDVSAAAGSRRSAVLPLRFTIVS